MKWISICTGALLLLGLQGCSWNHDYRGRLQPTHFHYDQHNTPINAVDPQADSRVFFRE